MSSSSQLFDLQKKFMKLSHDVEELEMEFRAGNVKEEKELYESLARIKQLDKVFVSLVSEVNKSNKPKLIAEFRQFSNDIQSQIKTLTEEIEKSIEEIQKPPKPTAKIEETPLQVQRIIIDKNNFIDSNDHRPCSEVCRCWFCWRKNPDLIPKDQDDWWRINVKNFFRQYCSLSKDKFLNRFRETRLKIFIQLSMKERIRLVQWMMELLINDFSDQMDHLIESIMKIASMLKIDNGNRLIMDWSQERIESGIYHDVCDYELLHRNIDEYSDTIREQFEINKNHSLDLYWNNLYLIVIMYDKTVIKSNTIQFDDYVLKILTFLLKQSKLKHYPEIYLDLLAESLLILTPKLISFNKSRKGPELREFFAEIQHHFLHTALISDEDERN
ncbi:hypothetical protein BLA29_000577 [Euroglyphus maynei]|uniref:Uncharacterized protein n=1 Tax=Euroglyphus maynei TaxID=6958 RepID=A0A1Y3APB4_EURMA|nr:hypothetical protein BLA29_000577 [Euroglyphus maynei]